VGSANRRAKKIIRAGKARKAAVQTNGAQRGGCPGLDIDPAKGPKKTSGRASRAVPWGPMQGDDGPGGPACGLPADAGPGSRTVELRNVKGKGTPAVRKANCLDHFRGWGRRWAGPGPHGSVAGGRSFDLPNHGSPQVPFTARGRLRACDVGGGGRQDPVFNRVGKKNAVIPGEFVQQTRSEGLFPRGPARLRGADPEKRGGPGSGGRNRRRRRSSPRTLPPLNGRDAGVQFRIPPNFSTPGNEPALVEVKNPPPKLETGASDPRPFKRRAPFARGWRGALDGRMG